ncbi:MAG TPA: hypothetical protein VKQ72_17970, partial [Aggregatilineales bacterium]|nr:hypothetical protein [Aggregatilineales bacterium]
PFLALWALRYKRWRFIVTFGEITLFLVAASFVLLPTWLTDWLRQVGDYPNYTDIGSPVWIITHMTLPFLGTIGELVLSGLLIALMLWAWWVALWKMRSATLDWTIALTLTVTMLIAPRTATPPHFVVFMFVLVFWFRQILRNYPQYGALWVSGIMLLTSVGLWWLFLSTLLPYRVEHPINYLPLPLVCLVVLLVTRYQWWDSLPTFKAASQQLNPN